MSVTGPGAVQGGIPIRHAPAAQPSARPADAPSMIPRDELEISTVGRMLQELQQTGMVRAERLAKIKAAIEAGEYETPQKLEAALTKLLAEVRAEMAAGRQAAPGPRS
jgi:negative regulator of flagellin synthesis FlgM